MAAKNLKVEDFIKFKVKDFVFRAEGKDPGDFISYDKSKCNGCGDCVLVCAASLWSVSAKTNKAKFSSRYKEHCLECAACYGMCDQEAIDFRYPNGGAGIIIKHG